MTEHGGRSPYGPSEDDGESRTDELGSWFRPSDGRHQAQSHYEEGPGAEEGREPPGPGPVWSDAGPGSADEPGQGYRPQPTEAGPTGYQAGGYPTGGYPTGGYQAGSSAPPGGGYTPSAYERPGEGGTGYTGPDYSGSPTYGAPGYTDSSSASRPYINRPGMADPYPSALDPLAPGSGTAGAPPPGPPAAAPPEAQPERYANFGTDSAEGVPPRGYEPRTTAAPDYPSGSYGSESYGSGTYGSESYGSGTYAGMSERASDSLGGGTASPGPLGGDRPVTGGYSTEGLEQRDRYGDAGHAQDNTWATPARPAQGLSADQPADPLAGPPDHTAASQAAPAPGGTETTGGIGTGSGNTWAFSRDDSRLPESVRRADEAAREKRYDGSPEHTTQVVRGDYAGPGGGAGDPLGGGSYTSPSGADDPLSPAADTQSRSGQFDAQAPARETGAHDALSQYSAAPGEPRQDELTRSDELTGERPQGGVGYPAPDAGYSPPGTQAMPALDPEALGSAPTQGGASGSWGEDAGQWRHQPQFTNPGESTQGMPSVDDAEPRDDRPWEGSSSADPYGSPSGPYPPAPTEYPPAAGTGEQAPEPRGRRSRSGRDPLAEEFPGFEHRPPGGDLGEEYPGYDNLDDVVETETLAVWTLVLGIASLVLACVGILPAVAAVILGPKARRKITKSRGRLEGRKFIKIGTLLAWIGIALWAVWIIAGVVLLVL